MRLVDRSPTGKTPAHHRVPFHPIKGDCCIMFRYSALVFLACAAASVCHISCGDDDGSSTDTGGSTLGTGDTTANGEPRCTIYWNNQNWEYSCPLGTSCDAFDIAACSPVGLARGTIGLGSPCAKDPSFEFGDDCAPDPRWAPNGSPKGTRCLPPSSGIDSRYWCTHGCSVGSDCADMGSDWGCPYDICREN